jgi:hypothetical protein
MDSKLMCSILTFPHFSLFVGEVISLYYIVLGINWVAADSPRLKLILSQLFKPKDCKCKTYAECEGIVPTKRIAESMMSETKMVKCRTQAISKDDNCTSF